MGSVSVLKQLLQNNKKGKQLTAAFYTSEIINHSKHIFPKYSPVKCKIISLYQKWKIK